MHDILLSGAYLVSATAISFATLGEGRGDLISRLMQRSLEARAHLFSCVSLSAAYAAHASQASL